MLYLSGRKEIATALNITASPLSFVLVTSDYIPSDNHTVQGDIFEEYQVAEEVVSGCALSPTLFLTHDDVVFTDIPSGIELGGVVLIHDSGEVGTSPLIAFFTPVGFPVVSDGTTIILKAPTAGLIQF